MRQKNEKGISVIFIKCGFTTVTRTCKQPVILNVSMNSLIVALFTLHAVFTMKSVCLGAHYSNSPIIKYRTKYHLGSFAYLLEFTQ